MADTDAKVKRLITVAKLHEEVEQYEEMAKAMKEVAQLLHGSDLPTDKKALSSEHRNHLSVAYKNVVGPKRNAWRIMASLEQKEEEGTLKREIAQECKDKIASQLKTKCDEVIEVIEEYLMPNAVDNEAKVFYVKMKGDYYRYLSEVNTKEDKEKVIEKSAKAYEQANEFASELAPTHPIRLGLALNYSVFYYEIKNEPDKACNLAKKAFDDAIAELDQLKEDVYKDSTLIMQLLRDNLTLWTADATGGDDGDD